MPTLTDMIKAKSTDRAIEEQNAKDTFRKTQENLKASLETKYCKRVGKILRIMNIIKDEDPKFYQSNKIKALFTDTFYHKLGFFSGLKTMGYAAGGACGNIPFTINGKLCTFEMNSRQEYNVNEFSRNCAKRFASEFEVFESNFKELINSEYGENAYDSYTEEEETNAEITTPEA